MEYGPRLQRQRSCSSYGGVLDVGSWCSRSRRRSYAAAGFSRRYYSDDHHYDDGEVVYDYEDQVGFPSGWRSLSTRWRELWRRILREKRRILNSGAAPMHASYDPYTYAQNFDDGSAWVEPENLSRSFSARFAAPSSRMLQRAAQSM